MDKKRIIDDMINLFRTCDGNIISADRALDGCEGLVMFDEPIFGVSAADDVIYDTFKKAEVIRSTARSSPSGWPRRS